MFVKLCWLVKISADITVKSGTLRSRLNFMPTNSLQNIHCDRAVQDRGQQFKSKTDLCKSWQRSLFLLPAPVNYEGKKASATRETGIVPLTGQQIVSLMLERRRVT